MEGKHVNPAKTDDDCYVLFEYIYMIYIYIYVDFAYVLKGGHMAHYLSIETFE